MSQPVAVAEPFSNGADGAGIPSAFCPPTHKARGTLRFDTVFGADGTFALAVNPSCVNDAGCVWYSNNASSTNNTTLTNSAFIAGNPGPIAQGTNPVTLLQNGQSMAVCKNLPYNTAQLLGIVGQNLGEFSPPNLRARVVSAGVKIKFSGTTLSDGGTAYSLVDPTHENLAGQTVNSYLSGMLDCQRSTLAQREEIQLNMHPVTEAQQLMSGSYDDVYTTLNAGGGWNQGYVFSGYGSNNKGTSTATGYPQAGLSYNNQLICTQIDPAQAGRSVSKLIYPLSRDNQNTLQLSVFGGSPGAYTPTYWAGLITTNGVISWTGSPPPTNASGLKMTWPDSGPNVTRSFIINYDSTGSGNWFASYPDGSPFCAQTGSINFSNGQLQGVWVEPSIIGGILINAGSAMAGQAIHVEYVVHVEYSGLGVQGRDNVNLPNIAGLAKLYAVVGHAKRSAAQALGSYKHHFRRQLREVGHHLHKEFGHLGHVLHEHVEAEARYLKRNAAQALMESTVALL